MDGKIIVIVKELLISWQTAAVPAIWKGGHQANRDMSRPGSPNTALGMKEIENYDPSMTSGELESNLEFKGLFGMIRPPRPEAAVAVALCGEAGIRAVMITGDHVLTASAIARELGILKEGDRAVSGAELGEDMSEDQLADQVEGIRLCPGLSGR